MNYQIYYCKNDLLLANVKPDAERERETIFEMSNSGSLDIITTTHITANVGKPCYGSVWFLLCREGIVFMHLFCSKASVFSN